MSHTRYSEEFACLVMRRELERLGVTAETVAIGVTDDVLNLKNVYDVEAAIRALIVAHEREAGRWWVGMPVPVNVMGGRA